MDLRALLFWEPGPVPVDPVLASAFWARILPPRVLTLSDLQRMSEAMGRAVGSEGGVAQLQRTSTVQIGGSSGPQEPTAATWADVADAIPADRRGYTLVAQGSAVTAPDPAVAPHRTPEREELSLHLGDGEFDPAVLSGRGAAHRQLDAIVVEWNRLGRPRRSPVARYPVMFIAALLVAVVPVVVLWVQGQLSLLTIPLVALLAVLAFIVAAPRIRDVVLERRAATAGLDIDYRLLDRIRLDRAATRRLWLQNVSSGVVGAAVGALATIWAG